MFCLIQRFRHEVCQYSTYLDHAYNEARQRGLFVFDRIRRTYNIILNNQDTKKLSSKSE